MSKQKAIRWTKTDATSWVSNREKTYTGTISYVAGTGYTLVVTPSAYTTVSTTLKNAKGSFRRYLHDK